MLEKENLSDHLPIVMKYSIVESTQQKIHKTKTIKPKIKYKWQCEKFLKNYGTRVTKVLEESNQMLLKIKTNNNKEEKQALLDDDYKSISHGITESAIKAFNEVEKTNKGNKKRNRSRRKKKSGGMKP